MARKPGFPFAVPNDGGETEMPPPDQVSGLFPDKDIHFEFDDTIGGPNLVANALAEFPGRISGTVLKDINMEVHLDGEFVGITEYQQFFSQTPEPDGIPEPATVLIGALGLLGMAWLGWHRRKRA